MKLVTRVQQKQAALAFDLGWPELRNLFGVTGREPASPSPKNAVRLRDPLFSKHDISARCLGPPRAPATGMMRMAKAAADGEGGDLTLAQILAKALVAVGPGNDKTEELLAQG